MKNLILYLIILIPAMLVSTIRIVDLDGNGQYISIQSGIDAAVNGDTVLVYPGTYFENINYAGKSIKVASLELITDNAAYRDSTVIDGQESGSCVIAAGNSALHGFTIQHGSGWLNNVNDTLGGGIFINDTPFFLLANCIIRDNSAFYGGGIFAYNSSILCKGLVISNNKGYFGGGINLYRAGTYQFDSIQRCSIFENYAGVGNDIYGEDLINDVHVSLNTFTVLNPGIFYIYNYRSTPNHHHYITYDILQGYREEVNQDLYVSPAGSDNNSGFSLTEPLKTIAWALHKIASDSLAPKTVYVDSGLYHTDDGQIFPLSVKDHVRIIGNEQQYPIIMNRRYWALVSCQETTETVISNFVFNGSSSNQLICFDFRLSEKAVFSNVYVNDMTLRGAGSGMYMSKDIIWDNVHFNNLISIGSSGIRGFPYKTRIINSSFNNCTTTYLGALIDLALRDSLYLSNVSITNCTMAMTGGSTLGLVQLQNYEQNNSVMNVNNLLLANNTTQFIGAMVLNSKYRESVFANNTIVNNAAGGFGVEFSGNWKVKNNIFDNYTALEINIPATYTYSTVVNVEDNLIKDYPNSINIEAPSVANFLQGNFSAIPGFAGTDWTDPLSYRLNFNSTCIDAGTPDTTGLNLPEFDLYGNPRIHNSIIDIGCNEWDGTANQEHDIPFHAIDVSLQAYPNPFRDYVSINYYLPKKADVSIEIYNLKGQRVKILDKGLKAKGNYSITWNGKDEEGNLIANGVYFAAIMSQCSHVIKKLIFIR